MNELYLELFDTGRLMSYLTMSVQILRNHVVKDEFQTLTDMIENFDDDNALIKRINEFLSDSQTLTNKLQNLDKLLRELKDVCKLSQQKRERLAYKYKHFIKVHKNIPVLHCGCYERESGNCYHPIELITLELDVNKFVNVCPLCGYQSVEYSLPVFDD